MLELNGKKIEIGNFPDGTLLIKEKVEREYATERSASIKWCFENNEELVLFLH